jgi:hypothetical protein
MDYVYKISIFTNSIFHIKEMKNIKMLLIILIQLMENTFPQWKDYVKKTSIFHQVIFNNIKYQLKMLMFLDVFGSERKWNC